MKKNLILLFLLISAIFLHSKSITQKKIQNNQSNLRSAQEISKQLNKKLDDLADDIIDGEKKLINISKEISNVKGQIDLLKNNEEKTNKELQDLYNQNKQLVENQKKIEENLIKIISENFALDLVLDGKGVYESKESIIASEVVSNLNNVLKDDFKQMTKNYEETSNLITKKSDKIKSIQNSIKDYKTKQEKLKSLELSEKKVVANLKRDKAIYTKKLSKIKSQQIELRKTLEKLAILAKEEERAKKEQKKKVRVVGSGYQASSVKSYRGKKTIAPLDSFTIKQKFGNYTDPIYKIKIFNESVVLHSKVPDAKVKSVFDGKVVFSKETNLLGMVVIIQHNNSLHTIYAHLSQIAPTIKVGTKVKKGYVIGRIKDDLTFEVTQKNYHINPLELF